MAWVTALAHTEHPLVVMAVTVGLPVVRRLRVPVVMAVLRVAALVVVLPLPVEPVAVPEVAGAAVEAGAANKP